jgi:hypothetical protein
MMIVAGEDFCDEGVVALAFALKERFQFVAHLVAGEAGLHPALVVDGRPLLAQAGDVKSAVAVDVPAWVDWCAGGALEDAPGLLQG